MDNVLHFISGMLWGIGVFALILRRWFKVERKLPYKWECPEKGCYFTASANYDPVMLLIVADHHKEEHAKEN